MSDAPLIRFVRADPGDAPSDADGLVDALARVLIDARRRRERDQAGGGETETETELEPAK